MEIISSVCVKKMLLGNIGKAITSLFLLANTAGAVGVDVWGHESANGIPATGAQAKLYRKPTGSVDTLCTNLDSWGNRTFDTFNLNPQANLGDTLFVEISKDTLGDIYSAKTMHILKSSGNYVLELHIDNPNNPSVSFTPNITNVFDTSDVDAPLKLIYSLDKNSVQPCTTEVDTGVWEGLTFYYDVHANLEKQDSVAQEGDSLELRLEKTRNDTVWATIIRTAVDKSYFDAMLVADSVWFPDTMIIIDTVGVEESRARDSKDFRVWPSITFGRVNVAGAKEFSVYDITGRRIKDYEIEDFKNIEIYDLSSFRSGIYFLKSKDSKEIRKIIKLK